MPSNGYVPMGGLQLLREIIEKNNAKVRVLIPADREAKLATKEFVISYPRIRKRELITDL
jgi:hypothetical protein